MALLSLNRSLDIDDACPTKSVLSLFQHVLTIVQTGDVGLFHRLVFLRSEYSRTNRDIEHLTLEIIGNPTQYPSGNLIVIDTASEQLEIQLTPPFTLRDSIIVETLAKLVRLLNFVCHNSYSFV